MTVIDTKKGVSYPNLKPNQAAKIVGVSSMTIYRWEKLRKVEHYNHYDIYFNEKMLKPIKLNV